MRNDRGQFTKGVKKSSAWRTAMSKRVGKGHSNWKGGQKVKMIQCGCGCGTNMNQYDNRNRVRKRLLGHQMVGRKQSPYQKECMSGENNPNWVKDRSKVKGRHERKMHDPEYKRWRKLVRERDGYKCRIGNSDCSGRIETHHIVPWRSDSTLRYEVNNGITLCHHHHPRKRKDEIELIPFFTKMVLSKGN